MRILLLTYIFILLVQCNPVSVDDLRKETPVMIAVVPNGTSTNGIQFFVLQDGESWGSPVTDASIAIARQNSSDAATLNYTEGNYVAAFPIEPGASYTLSGRVKGHDFTTEIAMPPALDFTIALNDTLIINSSSTGSSIVIVTWTELDNEKYSYVVRMDCLEETPVEIPFTVPSGNFATNFSGPQVAAGIIVSDTDFKYYGRHKLTVFAIPKSLESVFFYNAGDIRGLLTNGPDNILGIKGFATGVSKLETEFFLKPI
ncbi:MAG: hypothetical protein ACKVOK_01015 [Flavobacteriales bacterium]